MRAIQLIEPKKWPELRDIPVPKPGPGEVLLKVTAAGLCHSDIAVMDYYAEMLNYKLPMTLGHECVGTVVEAGQGTEDQVTIGESVMVYGPWGCGQCKQCSEGYENYCTETKKLGIFPPGLGHNGGCAEYMIVDSPRHLVPIGDLDPIKAVPLTDAALTPYHAIQISAPKLLANSTAVVIGVGGLGHVAIQLLKHLTPATVVAIDISETHLELAKKVDADVVLKSEQSAVQAVKDLTNGLGAEVVFDFVGAQPTIDLGAQMTKVRGEWNIVGIGGGSAKVGFGQVPYECKVLSPYWGTRGDLFDVVALAQRGLLDVHTETYTIEQGVEAYHRLHEGKIVGRAVLVP
ncbi:MAG: NAD(P)-dependent alcohol dehydrogenase [Propionibacteriaceae bacterium]|jgi:propanol-preferring alcohol dehydrogenase|nr:NAD(P)-dependent alcohol dehydrogenase [Propionibacteriaceae bacterium]